MKESHPVSSSPPGEHDTPRDRQFLGFARLLIEEMITKINQNRDDPTPQFHLIARRAYDFAIHVQTHTLGATSRDPHLVIRHTVPDMLVWPERDARQQSQSVLVRPERAQSTIDVTYEGKRYRGIAYQIEG